MGPPAPDVAAKKPAAGARTPDAAATKPAASATKSDAAATKPAAVATKPTATKPDPGARKPDAAAEPETAKTKAKAKPAGRLADGAVADGPVTSPSGKPARAPVVVAPPAPQVTPVVAETPPARPVAAEPPAPVAPAAQPQKLASAKDPGDTGAVFAAAKEYQPESGAGSQRAATQVASRDDDATGATPTVRAQLEPARPGDPHSANFAAVRADLGVSLAQRNVQFQTSGVAGTPKNFTDNPVPGVRFAGELYPFAFGDPHGWLAGFGIAGEVDQSMPFNLATAEPGVQLKGTERHYSVGVRYRIAFGHAETSPTLTLGVGYAAQTYTADRSGLATASSFDVPDVDYQMFDPGLALRLPLGRRFAFTLEGRGLLVTSAGAVQQPDQYGTTKLYGGTGSAGVELLFGNRVAVRVAVEATQLNLKFDGNGALSNNRDGNPMTVDVSQALDNYFGGSATLAVMY